MLSAQQCVRRSLLCLAKQKFVSALGAKEPEPKIDQFAVCVVRVPLYGELLGTENPENSARMSNRAAMYGVLVMEKLCAPWSSFRLSLIHI